MHAGGRGKGGGIKLAKSPAEAREIAAKMIGMRLVTHQTGPEGKEVHRVLVEEGCDIARELYLGMVLDRAIGRLTMMASTEGGVEIEEVAAKTPEKILKETVDPAVGLQGYQARKLAFGLGIPKESINKAVAFMTGLYKAFVESDCSLAEINPLVLTKQGDLLALDCKMGFDDNALYRHADIREMRDFAEEDPREVEAAKYDLSYIGLDGNIACMVNGAGLAMATMDIIKFYGGSPGELSRRRRRRHHREGDGGVQDLARRPEREGDSRQHLRRHHEVRRRRRGHRRGGQGSEARGAAGRAARRHERRPR